MSVEDSPEFMKALDEACEKQYRGYLYGGEFAKAHSKDTIADTMEEMQRQRRKIIAGLPEEVRRDIGQRKKEARIKMDPHMGEITANLKRSKSSSGLVCPVCGEGDHGNRLNGKPVCYMNSKHKAKGVDGPVSLMSLEKAKDWKPPTKKFKPKETWELNDNDIVKVK